MKSIGADIPHTRPRFVEGNPAKGHARLGPSSADRWGTCTASLMLEDILRRADLIHDDSPYANEGTLLHSLIANKLLGEPVETNDAMEKIADKALKLASPLWAGYDIAYVEQKVEIDLGDNHTFGTVDVLGFNKDMSKVLVLDWKMGAGVPVTAQKNPQLALYALGAMRAAQAAGGQPKELTVVIVQPRIRKPFEPLTIATYTPESLLAFTLYLVKAAQDIAVNAVQLRPSPKACQFCRNRAYCPALRTEADKLLKVMAFKEDDLSLSAEDLEEYSEILNTLTRARKFVETEAKRRESLPEAEANTLFDEAAKS